jgi:hypothetical protein
MKTLLTLVWIGAYAFKALLAQADAQVQPRVAAPEAVRAAPRSKAAQFRKADAQNRVFTMVRRYRYERVMYDPPVDIVFPADAVKITRSTPEDTLTSMLMAALRKDVDAWLGNWDGESRKLLLRRSDDDVQKRMETTVAGATEFTLVEWVRTGPYVVLRYRPVLAQPKASNPPRSQVTASTSQKLISVAFRLNAGWNATTDLDGDPVITFLETGQQAIERTVK